ncbi:hypothetical protein GCM10009818_32550 [Nakamurella flavida]
MQVGRGEGHRLDHTPRRIRPGPPVDAHAVLRPDHRRHRTDPVGRVGGQPRQPGPGSHADHPAADAANGPTGQRGGRHESATADRPSATGIHTRIVDGPRLPHWQ